VSAFVRAWCTSGLVLALLVPAYGQQGTPAPSASPTAPSNGSPPLGIEVDGLPDTAFVQQPLVVTVRLVLDTAWLTEHAVPLFQQRLDQPFHVVVPWLQAAEDRAVELLPPPAGVPTQKLALGDRAVPFVVEAERRVDGRALAVLQVRCRWLPLAEGDSLVAPVQVHYAFAERFQEDFLRGREPLDRQEATVASAARSLRVLGLPKPAPKGFHGAVGAFELATRASSAVAQVGGNLVVQLTVRGEGNQDRMAPLPPPSLPGFHVLGVASSLGDGERRFDLDLVPLRSGLTEVPSVPFVVFAPQTGRYETLLAPPVPVRIDPVPPGATLEPRVEDWIAADRRLLAAQRAWPWWVWALLASAGLGGLWFVSRLRGGRAARRTGARLRHEVEQALGQDPARVSAVLDALLAWRAGLPNWSSEGWAALAARGVPAEVIAAGKALHERLDAARFGGALPDAAALRALADALLA